MVNALLELHSQLPRQALPQRRPLAQELRRRVLAQEVSLRLQPHQQLRQRPPQRTLAIRFPGIRCMPIRNTHQRFTLVQFLHCLLRLLPRRAQWLRCLLSFGCKYKSKTPFTAFQ
jgi:hypothetical protein